MYIFKYIIYLFISDVRKDRKIVKKTTILTM